MVSISWKVFLLGNVLPYRDEFLWKMVFNFPESVLLMTKFAWSVSLIRVLLYQGTILLDLGFIIHNNCFLEASVLSKMRPWPIDGLALRWSDWLHRVRSFLQDIWAFTAIRSISCYSFIWIIYLWWPPASIYMTYIIYSYSVWSICNLLSFLWGLTVSSKFMKDYLETINNIEQLQVLSRGLVPDDANSKISSDMESTVKLLDSELSYELDIDVAMEGSEEVAESGVQHAFGFRRLSAAIGFMRLARRHDSLLSIQTFLKLALTMQVLSKDSHARRKL